MSKTLEEAAGFHARGDIGRAAGLYREILKQSPHQPDALLMMGVIAQQGGNPPLALQFVEAALAARPDFARAWFNRSVVLRALGRNAEALQSARLAAESAPDLAEAWDMIGQIQKDQGDFSEALACHSRAVRLQPDNPHFHGNYALALSTAGDLPAAYRAASRATALDPDYPPVILGNVIKAMGYPEQAAALFARAHALSPALTGISVSEAMARLQMGDMQQGWTLWETRTESEHPLNAIPMWRGQKGTRLLLQEDHGLGDVIQYLRYIPLLGPYAEHIELCVRTPLHRLCAENFPGAALITEDAQSSSAAMRFRWSSLPFFFMNRGQVIPGAPYLTASDQRRAFWRAKLAGIAAPRIGLIWAGNKNFLNDYKRSIDVNVLQPLLACGASFISMQKDRPEKAAGIFDAGPFLEDFADTAALIAELDLVITVDTATAHLAGALGTPVFIMLPFDPDWRWLLGREDSPWYPSARLFRQKKPGDWAEVVGKITGEVRKLATGDKSVLQPPRWQGENLLQNPNALPLP